MRRLANLAGFSETMALALVVWLCSLLLVGLVVVPLAGSRAAILVGLGLLVALLIICWGICGYRVLSDVRQPERRGREAPTGDQHGHSA